MLEIRLLGQFDVRFDGQPVDIASRPAQSLLAYLCLTAGAPHRRERLAALFWPDTPDANARSNLRHALWRLRAALDPAGEYLIVDSQVITFNINADYRLDAEILQHEFSGDWPTEVLIETISVYNGELLPGFYAEWTNLERERLHGVFERQMQTLLERLIAEQRWPEVLAWSERWIALGGAPEPAYRALMTAHAALGDMASVAAAYQRCVEALRGELGVDPAAQTRALFDELRQASSSTLTAAVPQPAPVPTPPAQPARLPAQTTPFLGREELLAEIDQHIAEPSCRLITLSGPGGIGKTRLALQAAASYLDHFPDGIFFVPLAPVTAAELITPTIAHVLAFAFYGGLDPQEQLFNYLRDKRLLLVLDNFEHLLEGAALITELLEKAPQLKCLVTSRERLNLRGEWLLTVDGLRVPESTRAADLETYSAVQLFLQSARRVRAGWVFDAADKSQVVRICRLVEGMPLAIELAAAWVRAISLPEIAQEIQRSLDFLSTTMRDLPQRHRSLRAVFDHSWELLTDEERRAFQSLSIFRGGFQREAAEAVARASLPVLSALMDKSLLRRTPAGRYELHELLRQYARDKLAESNEEAQIRDRHLAYYLKLAEEADPQLRGAGQLEWLDRLETEHGNLHLAIHWANTAEKVEAGLRLAGSLARFLYLHGYWNEGRDWIQGLLKMSAEALGADSAPAFLQTHAKALAGLAWLENESGQDIPLYEQSLALCRQTGDRWGEAFALRGIGATLVGEEIDYERGEATLRESLALFETLKDSWGIALVKFNLGWLADHRAEHEQKLKYWNESLTGFREAGDRWGMSVTLGALGYAARFGGDYRQAAEMSKESLRLFKELGDRAGASESLSRLASVAYRRSDYTQATELYEAGLALARELGYRWYEANIISVLGLIAAYQGQYDRATELLATSLRLGEELVGQEESSFIVSYAALTAYFKGEIEHARALWEETLATYRRRDERVAMAYSLNSLGVLALLAGDLARAETLLHEGHTVIRESGDKRGLAISYHDLGWLAHARKDYLQAISLFKQALTLRKEMGDKQGIAESLEGLASALDTSEAETAAKLFGAAEQLRAKIGAPLPPVEQGRHAYEVEVVRAQLGEQRFEAAHAAGREMALEAVLKEALAGGVTSNQ